MTKRFTQSFKLQAVEKALNRPKGTSLEEISENLRVGRSTLGRWLLQSEKNELELSSLHTMTKEKRPQDFSLEERLDLIITCSSLDESQINKLCRKQGIYAHHIKQWKEDFIAGSTAKNHPKALSETKILKAEVKTLKKEINRKDKALAETAALLVLQKKVQAIWGNDEASSQ